MMVNKWKESASWLRSPLKPIQQTSAAAAKETSKSEVSENKQQTISFISESQSEDKQWKFPSMQESINSTSVPVQRKFEPLPASVHSTATMQEDFSQLPALKSLPFRKLSIDLSPRVIRPVREDAGIWRRMSMPEDNFQPIPKSILKKRNSVCSDSALHKTKEDWQPSQSSSLLLEHSPRKERLVLPPLNYRGGLILPGEGMHLPAIRRRSLKNVACSQEFSLTMLDMNAETDSSYSG